MELVRKDCKYFKREGQKVSKEMQSFVHNHGRRIERLRSRRDRQWRRRDSTTQDEELKKAKERDKKTDG